MLDSLRPGKNPILRREARLLWHDLMRQPMFWVVLAAALGHLGFSVLHLNGRFVNFQAYSQYYVQFSFFHLVVYLGPALFVYWSWKRWRRSTRFEEVLLTPATRADVFWGFLLPRVGLLLALIAAFYLPMLPWEDWWLLRFENEPLFSFSEDTWTSLHVLITWSYLLSYLLYGSVLALWVQERIREHSARRLFLFAILLAGVDMAGLLLFIILEGEPVWSELLSLTIPDILLLLLIFHSHPHYGPWLELLKIGLAVWMARSVIRGLRARE